MTNVGTTLQLRFKHVKKGTNQVSISSRPNEKDKMKSTMMLFAFQIKLCPIYLAFV